VTLRSLLPRGLGPGAHIGIDYKGLEVTALAHRAEAWGPSNWPGAHGPRCLPLANLCRPTPIRGAPGLACTERGYRFWAPVLTSRGAAGDDMVKLLRRYGHSADQLHPRYCLDSGLCPHAPRAPPECCLVHSAGCWAPVHQAVLTDAWLPTLIEDFCMPAKAVPAG